jgi:Fe-S-cluster containining protein
MLIQTLKPIFADKNLTLEMIDFMRSLYLRIDGQIGQVQTTCQNCRRCCDFALSGLNLYLTNLEMAFFITQVKTIPDSFTNRCPWLNDKSGCTVRHARPIGCRTFFCKPPAHYDQQVIYEDALSQVKGFLEKNNLPYSYTEWLKTLQEYKTTD